MGLMNNITCTWIWHKMNTFVDKIMKNMPCDDSIPTLRQLWISFIKFSCDLASSLQTAIKTFMTCNRTAKNKPRTQWRFQSEGIKGKITKCVYCIRFFLLLWLLDWSCGKKQNNPYSWMNKKKRLASRRWNLTRTLQRSQCQELCSWKRMKSMRWPPSGHFRKIMSNVSLSLSIVPPLPKWPITIIGKNRQLFVA